MLHLAQRLQLHRPSGLQTPPAPEHWFLSYTSSSRCPRDDADQALISEGVNAATLPESGPDLPCWKLLSVPCPAKWRIIDVLGYCCWLVHQGRLRCIDAQLQMS